MWCIKCDRKTKLKFLSLLSPQLVHSLSIEPTLQFLGEDYYLNRDGSDKLTMIENELITQSLIIISDPDRIKLKLSK